jgi:heptosyltransferase-2
MGKAPSLLVELPPSLGESVMASGALVKLVSGLRPREVTLMGREPILELLLPLVPGARTLPYRKEGRWKRLFQTPRQFDIGVSFRRSLYSKLFLGKSCRKTYIFPKNIPGHLVEQYNIFIGRIAGGKEILPPQLSFTPHSYPRPTIGIYPGGGGGEAGRWYPDRFAQVANRLGKEFDIVIFGEVGEEKIAREVEKNLTISNYQNLTGKLSLPQLSQMIGGLSLFLTNDSGAMHIASAYQVPIVAIFGPTDWRKNSPYSSNYKIVRVPLRCSPCHKGKCPLKNHQCMEEITPEIVIETIFQLLEEEKEGGGF